MLAEHWSEHTAGRGVSHSTMRRPGKQPRNHDPDAQKPHADIVHWRCDRSSDKLSGPHPHPRPRPNGCSVFVFSAVRRSLDLPEFHRKLPV